MNALLILAAETEPQATGWGSKAPIVPHPGEVIIGLIFFFFVYLKNYRAGVSPPALPVARSGAALPPQPRLQASPNPPPLDSWGFASVRPPSAAPISRFTALQNGER